MSPLDRLDLALVGTGFGYRADRRAPPGGGAAAAPARRSATSAAWVARRSICVRSACGRLDAYYETGLNPWDVAAGGVIAAEAGARLTDLDGDAPRTDESSLRRPGLHERLLERAPSGRRPRNVTTDDESPLRCVLTCEDHDRNHPGTEARARRMTEGDDRRGNTNTDGRRRRAHPHRGQARARGRGLESSTRRRAARTRSQSFSRQPADVVLIDIMLPGIDGFEVCRSIRRISDVPIIMVTARADTHDVVAGLEAGADDYLTKPFAPKELSARIRALLRRARTIEPEHAAPRASANSRSCPTKASSARSGEELHLTKTEFRLLVELATNPGRVLSREALLERVWGYGYFGDGRLVDVHVRRLRTKVEARSGQPPARRHRARARLQAPG